MRIATASIDMSSQRVVVRKHEVQDSLQRLKVNQHLSIKKDPALQISTDMSIQGGIQIKILEALSEVICLSIQAKKKLECNAIRATERTQDFRLLLIALLFKKLTGKKMKVEKVELLSLEKMVNPNNKNEGLHDHQVIRETQIIDIDIYSALSVSSLNPDAYGDISEASG